MDIAIKVSIFFDKSFAYIRGLEMFDHQGKLLLQTVKYDNIKTHPSILCYSFSIGQGERIVAVKCRRYGYGMSDVQLVIGR